MSPFGDHGIWIKWVSISLLVVLQLESLWIFLVNSRPSQARREMEMAAWHVTDLLEQFVSTATRVPQTFLSRESDVSKRSPTGCGKWQEGRGYVSQWHGTFHPKCQSDFTNNYSASSYPSGRTKSPMDGEQAHREVTQPDKRPCGKWQPRTQTHRWGWWEPPRSVLRTWLPSPKAWALKPSGQSAGQGFRTLRQEKEVDEDCQDQHLLIDSWVSGFWNTWSRFPWRQPPETHTLVNPICMSLPGLLKQSNTTWVALRKERWCPTVLEAGSPRSRCQRVGSFWGLWGRFWGLSPSFWWFPGNLRHSWGRRSITLMPAFTVTWCSLDPNVPLV